MGPLTDGQMRYAAAARASGLVLFLMPRNTACAASVPLEQAGSLSSYQHLTPNSGLLTQAQLSVNRDGVLAAKTVRIIPTSLSAVVAEAKLSEAQLRLIANAVDRSLCTGTQRPLPDRALRPGCRFDCACIHHAHHSDRRDRGRSIEGHISGDLRRDGSHRRARACAIAPHSNRPGWTCAGGRGRRPDR
jgi:hypothetical protein